VTAGTEGAPAPAAPPTPPAPGSDKPAPDTGRRGTGGSRRVKTPTVLQMEAVECGAAALAIVLAYHGRFVTLEELRLACGVSRDGSNALNMIKAVRNYGLEGKAFKREPGELPGLPLPFVVFWNFNHFLVVEGFGPDRVYLNDPASGRRTVSWQEFDESFTGIALTFAPGPDFQRDGTAYSLWGGLRSRLRGSRTAVAFVVLAGLMLVVPGLLAPAFTRVFIDRYLVAGVHDWLPPLLEGMAATVVLLVALTVLQQFYLYRLGQRLSLGGSSRYFWHVLRLPMTFFSMRFAGDIAGRAQLNTTVAQLLSGELASAVVGMLTIVFYAAVMIQYDVVLTAVGIAVGLVNFFALRFISQRRRDANQRLLKEQGNATSTAFGGLQNIETLKATGTDSDFFARWSGFQAKALNAQQELGVSTQVLAAIPAVLAALTTVVILGLGGERVIAGTLSIGSLIAFQLLMASFTQPINQLVSLGASIQEAEGSMIRLDDVLRYPTDTVLDHAAVEGTRRPAKLAGALELRDVTFGYSPLSPPLIEGLSLNLQPGTRIALVGGSGSGKSTIARLITGLYEPWQGQILFDGRPRDAHARETITGSLAAVDQEIFLFEGTVADNLTLWDRTVPEDQYVAAAHDAAVHDVVASRTGGYESRVEEGGRNFSGGQCQRLEIARALTGDPRILVLDEATAALDPTTEKAIDGHLRERGCTCVIVAHRLSTIRDCDEILVLDGGKVVQRGRHEDLKDVEGAYARLVAAG
jgi:NHLM bacteriocin system ABC transporter peptidase/ATP-binding protein